MSVRARTYVWMVVTVLAALVYTRLAGGWTDLAFFAGMAGLIAVLVAAGNFWIEFAPDGAFRRVPRT